MTVDATREPVASLIPLFEKAEREGLWFFSPYQQLWFSPRELRAAQAEGRFRWGAVNWKLRPPTEYRDEARARWAEAEGEFNRVLIRIEMESK